MSARKKTKAMTASRPKTVTLARGFAALKDEASTALTTPMGQELGVVVRVDSIVDVGRSVTIMPIGDVHWPRHHAPALNMWRHHVRNIRDAKVVLVGDMFDLERKTESDQLRTMDQDGSLREKVDAVVMDQVREFAEFLTPVADRIIACVPGNHTHLFKDGMTSDEKLMDEMGIRHVYRNNFAWIALRFVDGQTRDILVSHSAGARGSGRTKNADRTAFCRVEQGFGGIDAFFMGHTHLKYIDESDHVGWQQDADGLGRRAKAPALYVRCGAFAAHDYESPGSYPAKRLLGPHGMGIVGAVWFLGPDGRIQRDKIERDFVG